MRCACDTQQSDFTDSVYSWNMQSMAGGKTKERQTRITMLMRRLTKDYIKDFERCSSVGLNTVFLKIDQMVSMRYCSSTLQKLRLSP